MSADAESMTVSMLRISTMGTASSVTAACADSASAVAAAWLMPDHRAQLTGPEGLVEASGESQEEGAVDPMVVSEGAEASSA